jgi:hypothetical protein
MKHVSEFVDEIDEIDEIMGSPKFQKKFIVVLKMMIVKNVG